MGPFARTLVPPSRRRGGRGSNVRKICRDGKVGQGGQYVHHARAGALPSRVLVSAFDDLKGPEAEERGRNARDDRTALHHHVA
jgi:hypothetical protein